MSTAAWAARSRDEPLVVGGEPAVLVGEVEGGDHVAPEHDRHGEERVEVGVGGGPPPVEAGVAADVVAAERRRVEQRRAEHPVGAGEGPDGVDLLVGEAGGDPPAEPVAVLVGHAQRGVAGARPGPGPRRRAARAPRRSAGRRRSRAAPRSPRPGPPTDPPRGARYWPTAARRWGVGVPGERPRLPPPPTSAPCLGDRYELVRHIARGGMGDVYEADDRCSTGGSR